MKNFKIKPFFKLLISLTLIVLLSIQSNFAQKNPSKQSVLSGKLICIDPGHGGSAATDSYRQGPTGEREEWIDLRVALLLKEILEEKGARVLMTRSTDIPVPLAARSKMAIDQKADFFISIHHNATADPSVNFPIIYYHGLASENQAGVHFGKLLAKNLIKYMYKAKTPVSIVSDFTIFAGAGSSVLRGTYGIPGVLAEASLFTNPEEEVRLKTREHNYNEALAMAKAIETFFIKGNTLISPKNTSKFPPKFNTLQEADRMSDIAKRWHEDYLEGKKLMKNKDVESLQKAFDLFTQSARSFPDSYVAAKCHQYRAKILRKQGKIEEAMQEELRVKEFYPN